MPDCLTFLYSSLYESILYESSVVVNLHSRLTKQKLVEKGFSISQPLLSILLCLTFTINLNNNHQITHYAFF
jgi:hypothetical protein